MLFFRGVPPAMQSALLTVASKVAYPQQWSLIARVNDGLWYFLSIKDASRS